MCAPIAIESAHTDGPVTQRNECLSYKEEDKGSIPFGTIDSTLMDQIAGVYSSIERLINDSKYSQLNKILSEVRVRKVASPLLVALLTAAHSARNTLPAYADLLELARKEFARRGELNTLAHL